MQNIVKDKDRFQEKLEQSAANNTAFRILVVDDELSILELVKTALETLENYDVEVASSAADALEWVLDSDKPFDCFLFDIQMPEIDGIELLKQIRILPEYVETPILMLTAMSDRKYIDHAFLEGASDYVNKPFDFLELRSRIKRAYAQVEARRKTESTTPDHHEVDRQVVQERQFEFEDPLSIEGVKQSLRYIEFDNYVAQLARRKLFDSRAISIMMHDARLFYDLAGCTGFRAAIREMAYAIQCAISEFDCVFSYRGGGVFLLVIHGRKFPDCVVSPQNLGEYLGAQTRQHITDDRVEILVGNAVSLRVLSKSGAANVLQKAVTAVQQLENELRKTEQQAVSYELSEVSPRQVQAQRNTYETVLNELYGEESYLGQR
ncbi:response regulator [Roseovarius sp. 2305UL8-3]|uniref:response regulator n=1 Tax=Roseovarius conchicola TaxID=3121636 RepID=UPI0035279FDF